MKTIIFLLFLMAIVISTPSPGTYILSFEYAARKNVAFSSCLGDVIWNNIIVFSVVPTDYIVHTVQFQVIAVVGLNLLQFEGKGTSDALGLTFTNVVLIQQGDLTNTNIVINGDFSLPNQIGGWQIYNSIPGWTGVDLELGTGTIYNNNWPSGTQVIELDGNRNFIITQELTFAAHIPFDINGPLSQTGFQCLHQQDYQYANVRIDSNSLGVGASHAIQTLQNAQAAGLQTDIYLVLCPGFNVDAQVLIIQNIPTNLYSTVWLKVKENRNPQLRPECIWQSNNQAYNCWFLTTILQKITNLGINSGLFSTKNIWNRVFANSCNVGSIGIFSLWYGNYQTNGVLDANQSFADYVVFGGWNQPTLKQIIGSKTVTLCNTPGWNTTISIDWHPHP